MGSSRLKSEKYEHVNEQSDTWFEQQPSHDHYTLLYNNQDEQFQSVIPFIKEGIQKGDRCVYVVGDNTRTEVIELLSKTDIEVQKVIDSGQLSIQTTEGFYTDNGNFDIEYTIDCVKEEISKSLDIGYEQLRITGELSWAKEANIDAETLKQYEDAIDDLFPSSSLIALCQYNRSHFSSAHLRNVLEQHPRILYRGEERLNHYYRHPKETNSSIIDQRLKSISELQETLQTIQNQKGNLSFLYQVIERLQQAEPEEIESVAAAIVSEILDPSLIAFHSFERRSGKLQSRLAQQYFSEGSENRLNSVPDKLDEKAWEAFVENQDLEFELNQTNPISGTVYPIDQHGAISIGTNTSEEISDVEHRIIKAICRIAASELDSHKYESDINETEVELKSKDARIQRLNQVNSIIRSGIRSVVEASTAQEVVEELCDSLVDEAGICFVWYGSYDSIMDTLEPECIAGDDLSYLDSLSIDENGTGKEPSRVAVQTQETQVRRSLYDRRPLEYWEKQALKRGYKSVVSIPICYDESIFGVISLYSDVPRDLDEDIVSIYEEISDLVAFTINNFRRKQALVTDTVTELKIDVTHSEFEIIEFAQEHSWEVEIEDVVADQEDGFRVFASVYHAKTEELESFAAMTPTVDRLEILEESESIHMCEFQITEHCFISEILRHNAVPQRVKIEDSEAYLTVHLPQEMNVREFMDMFRSKHPHSEVAARSTEEQSLRRISDIDSKIEEELTDRQLEVLRLAYHSGYFDRPRNRTAEDIAEILDVSHPTVGRHLREAERKIFALLLEDP